MIGFILDSRVSEAIESCKMSLRYTLDRVSAIPLRCDDLLCVVRHPVNEMRCIYDLFVFLYPLNIITFRVYRKCQSHSSTG